MGRNMLVLLAREVVVEPRITDVDVHGNCTATGTSNHNLRLMLIEFSLGGRYSSGEIIVIECRIDDLVAVIFQVGRFDATRDRVPPLWSWFPAGVCHAYAGCGTTCDSNAYGLTGAPGGEKQGSTAPSITGNPSTLANRGGPGTATRTLRKIRTLTDSPQISTPAMGSLSAGVVADPAASSASGTVPSSYAIPSLPVAPLLRRHTMKPVHTDESTVRPELRTYSVPR